MACPQFVLQGRLQLVDDPSEHLKRKSAGPPPRFLEILPRKSRKMCWHRGKCDLRCDYPEIREGRSQQLIEWLATAARQKIMTNRFSPNKVASAPWGSDVLMSTSLANRSKVRFLRRRVMNVFIIKGGKRNNNPGASPIWDGWDDGGRR